MPPLTYIHASDATRCRTCGGGIVGNASKRCNAGAVTLGKATGKAGRRALLGNGHVSGNGVTYY